MRHPFRRKNLSPRLIPFYLVVGAGLWLAEPTARSLVLGAPLLAAGTLLRAWGAGHLVKTDRLAVSGPYAHLRHPLYAGTLLLALGFGVAAGPTGVAIAALVFAPAFFGYYLPYKERVESERLRARHGAVYDVYRAAVPALVPRLRSWEPPADWPRESQGSWHRARFRDNDELGTVIGIVSGAALLVFLASRPG